MTFLIALAAIVITCIVFGLGAYCGRSYGHRQGYGLGYDHGHDMGHAAGFNTGYEHGQDDARHDTDLYETTS